MIEVEDEIEIACLGRDFKMLRQAATESKFRDNCVCLLWFCVSAFFRRSKIKTLLSPACLDSWKGAQLGS